MCLLRCYQRQDHNLEATQVRVAELEYDISVASNGSFVQRTYRQKLMHVLSLRARDVRSAPDEYQNNPGASRTYSNDRYL